MDGKTINKPEWLKRGALVKVQHWYGVVEDVALSETRAMALIKSPKGVWRNQRDAAEWLEYIEGQIVPADPAALEQDIKEYAERIQRMLSELNAFRELLHSEAFVAEEAQKAAL
jgi:hypothetical protein